VLAALVAMGGRKGVGVVLEGGGGVRMGLWCSASGPQFSCLHIC
jgi:hypothetical protein